jgi:hypothetical protein
LAAINLIAIILIGILYNTVEGEKKEIHEHEKKPEPSKEPQVSFHDHFHAVVKERKKKSELAFPAIISFIVAIIVFLVFQYSTTAVEVLLLFAVVI